MVSYKIKPRLIKRLFRKPKLVFELIKVERGQLWNDFGDVETVIFKSEDLEEIKNIKESLENIN